MCMQKIINNHMDIVAREMKVEDKDIIVESQVIKLNVGINATPMEKGNQDT